MMGDKRQKKKIKIWMLETDLREADIVRELGESQPLVNMTINGRKNNRNVLQFLLDKGCPAEWLDLPEDMKEAA